LLAQLLISFREGFEAAVLVSMVLLYLSRVGRRRLAKPLLLGGFFGVAMSLAVGFAIHILYLFIEAKELFEALSSFVAVAILTGVIYWMSGRGGSVAERLRLRVEASGWASVSMGLLGFALVFREGVEAVLFMMPLLAKAPWETLVGGALGSIGALVLAALIFVGGLRINFKTFFYSTSILLIFIAGGILGYGIHELIEYGEGVGWKFGLLAHTVYALPIGESSLLHEENILGSILATLLGYSTKMELFRFVLQVGYVVSALALLVKSYRRGAPGPKPTPHK